MAGWLYSPALRIRSTAKIADPAVIPASRIYQSPSPGLFNGGDQYIYKWQALMDGVGKLHSAISNITSYIVTGASTNAITVDFAHQKIDGAIAFRLYRRKSTEALYKVVYKGDEQVFVDRYNLPRNEEAPASSNNTDPAGSTSIIDFDLRPGAGIGGTFAGSQPGGAAGFRSASVEDLFFEDLSDPTEFVSAKNRELLVKERGFRLHVVIRFTIAPGSPEDEAILAMYTAKANYPRGTSPGVIIELALDYGFGLNGSGPKWIEVRPIGNFPRTPRGGKQKTTEFAIEFVSKRRLLSFPDMGEASNFQVGTGHYF